MSVTLTNLTNGERLILARRRAGRTQKEESARRKVTVQVYRAMEKDQEKSPRQKLSDLSDGERCYIARRRAGKTVAWAANKIGCCRLTIANMESDKASAEKLIGLWAA